MEEGRKIPVQVVGPIVGENEVTLFCHSHPVCPHLSALSEYLHSLTGTRPRRIGSVSESCHQPASQGGFAQLLATSEGE